MRIEFSNKKEICLLNKIIEYTGVFNNKQIDIISDNLDEKLRFVPEKKRINTLSFSIELLSIFNRVCDLPNKETSFFCTGFSENQIYLFAQSIVNHYVSDKIISLLDEINNSILDKDRLKALYRANLEGFDVDERTSLGFLEIARKTGNEILYNQQKESNELDFFSVLISVNV